MGKFNQYLTDLSARHISVFLFLEDNFSTGKFQRIFTKLSMCIDMWRSGLGLLMCKFCPFLMELSVLTHPYFCVQMITSVNVHVFSSNLLYALILWRSGLALLMDKFCHFGRVICLPQDRSGVLSFHILTAACFSELKYTIFTLSIRTDKPLHTVKTLITGHKMRHLFRVYTVCHFTCNS